MGQTAGVALTCVHPLHHRAWNSAGGRCSMNTGSSARGPLMTQRVDKGEGGRQPPEGGDPRVFTADSRRTAESSTAVILPLKSFL